MENAYKVKSRVYWLIAFFLFLCLVPFAKAQDSFTAASCNRINVRAIVNGSTHTAVDRDTTTNCELSEVK